jgi:tetratricopeptide (TPR) repeat protein
MRTAALPPLRKRALSGRRLAFAFVLFAASVAAEVPSVGTLVFPNSGSAAAQKAFLHGLAQLHNFEYEDAAAAFQEAEKIDPDFAMAWWGEAMTKNHPVWMQQDLEAARAILNRLAPTPEGRLAKAKTAREKAYVGSLDVLYGTGTKEQRDFAYAEAMGALSERFPDDPDAAAFYALSLLGTAHEGRDVPTYMKAAGILEPLFCRYPEHPGIAHYLIHACDDPVHASLALAAARAYSKIAPDAGHAQHMCSHIFLALGMWDDVVAANETAIAVVNRQRSARGLPEVGCGHYPLWLEYGYLQQGRLRDAERVLSGCAAQIARGSSTPHEGHLDPDRSGEGSYTEMWAFRILAGGASEPPAFPAAIDLAHFPSARLTYAYARGLDAAIRGTSADARAALGLFDEARRGMDEELRAEGKAMDAKRLDVMRLELEGATDLAEGKGDEGFRLLREAATLEEALPVPFGPPFVEKPSHEMLGEALLSVGRPAEAAKAFEGALARAPLRSRSLLGLARALGHSGETEKSRRAYAELHQIEHRADTLPDDVLDAAGRKP